ncbi:uncharacterized protein K460DRAFT_361185 [Cucurbitaria berberidis CBS 394.84]|uniref:Uncharacterized protein n=1 Tax=Cucurbitaria berberidis CBS 394.84 TaxID=1168544 RepID=A0A9P4GRB7_9PLEO|nr:uncharacterized protein K460DRAFT_361185 [Cucurbitaria berberidis CBS 394.84]KAF1850382.1 hypothetical protein K460DRAFT_361185 [Cucurbitaria berberidis CBS 394.84]
MSQNNNFHYPQRHSASAPDSPIQYEGHRDYQTKRPRKRRRAEEDADAAYNSERERERACKVRVTAEMRERENARYGVIPAAGRQAVRRTEAYLRTVTSAVWEQLALLYRETQLDLEQWAAEYREEEERARQERDGERKARERARYQATVEEADDTEEEQAEMPEEDNGEAPNETTGFNSTNDSNTDTSHPKPFEPLPKPAPTLLPPHLIPARVPPVSANGRLFKGISDTRPKYTLRVQELQKSSSPSRRKQKTKPTMQKGTPSRPSYSSTDQHLATPPKKSGVRDHRSPSTQQSPSDLVIEKILGRRTTRTSRAGLSSLPVTRPALTSKSTPPPSRPKTQPNPAPPSKPPPSSKPQPTLKLRRQGAKAQNAPQQQTQFSGPSRPSNFPKGAQESGRVTHDRSRDVLDGLVLVEYKHSRTSRVEQNEEFMSSGGLGGSG